MKQDTDAPHREFTANRFIHELQRSVERRSLIQILLGIVLFISGFFLVTYVSYQRKAEDNLRMLVDSYLSVYTESTEFLNAADTEAAFYECLADPDSPRFEYILNRFNSKNEIGSEIILTDADGRLLDSSFTEIERTEYLLEYNRAVCFNVKNSGTRGIYVTVYFDIGNYSDYLFIRPMYDGDELRGYISLFRIGADWNFSLSDRNYDGFIVDGRCNVIYRSKAGFANQSGKCYPQSGKICMYNGERYWTESEELRAYGVTVYSLVYYPNDDTIYIGAGVILLMGLLWFTLARWMSRTMAEYNAGKIHTLVREIRQIQDGDYYHRIHMHTDDEFDEVAHRINRMMDSVRELNERNTELITLSSRLEMGQLEAQMNPHFLYNTLEIIRNLVMLDSEKAEELIERLVHILRYSVSQTIRDVPLREDLEYIRDYLYIQQIRFGARFCCSMRFDGQAEDCIVPKLLLQPVIENSIKYGFQAHVDLHVEIEGSVEQGILTIFVRDDGPGMDEKEAAALSESLNQTVQGGDNLGLHNIARRLYLQYGKRSGMEIRSRKGEGFEVCLRIDQMAGLQGQEAEHV